MLVRLAAVTWQVFGPEAEQAVVYNHVAHQTIEVRLLPLTPNSCHLHAHLRTFDVCMD